MREIILGTAGHVDHGKTSLIKALTGIDTDRLKEEKARGITIELGFAHLDLPCGRRIGIVDVPGHEKFVKNMVAGAAGMDLVAFIVAADEGIMPQTEEHYQICRLLGVRDGIIVLTKRDMVEPEWLDMVEEDVREFFAQGFLAEAPVVAVSSATGEGLDDLVAAIDAKVSAMDRHEAHGPFRLAVDRVFSMKGFGTVITGTSISGRIGVDEEIMFYPGELKARIRGIQVHGEERQAVEAGHRTAINLQGVEKEEIRRGSMAATPGCMTPSTLLDAEFHLLPENRKALKNRTQVRVHVGSGETAGRLVMLEGDAMAPGERAFIQIILKDKVAVWPGDRFVIRSYSPVRTLGGGVVLNNAPPKRKRATPGQREAARAALRVFRSGSDEEKLLLFLEESGSQGLSRDALAVRLGIFGKALKKLLDSQISRGRVLVVESEGRRLLSRAVLDRLTAGLTALLEAYHRDHPLRSGIPMEELRSSTRPPMDPRLFQFCLNSLVRRGEVVQEEGEVRLAAHEVDLAGDDDTLRQALVRLFEEAGLRPPLLRDVPRLVDAPEGRAAEMLRMLEGEGVLARVSETLYFAAKPLDRLQEQVRSHLEEHGEIDAQAFKALTGLTRKFSIPLLEYFDRIRMTMRIGDKRVLRRGRG